MNTIPEMTDPLGKYWDQPDDIRDAPMDDKHVILTPRQFEDLADYSLSQPSGTYVGKCWKAGIWDGPPHRHGKIVGWQLAWFGHDPEPGYLSNNYRGILVVE